jgi:glycosyltransferase involved in cell wall biosynthesis
MNTNIIVSVVIPTRNRKKILKKCLKSLNQQTIDNSTFEIIIIDDGSNDNNKLMIEQINLKPHYIYKYQDQTGPAGARNTGIKLANGKYIIFIDDDIIVSENFIESHLKKHKNKKEIIVHGPVIYTNNLDNPTSAEKKISDFSNAFFATGNASLEKKHLIKAGLFEEKFYEYGWEDLELGMRLKKLGLTAVKEKNAVGYHLKHKFTPNKIANIKEREKQRGRMAVLFHKINPSFSVKSTTLYWKPFILLIKLLTFKRWPNTKFAENIVTYFHEKNIYFLRDFFLYFIKLDSYLKGLYEGYK